VPALFEMLLEYSQAADRGLPPSLRLALLSGDWLALDLPARARALLPKLELISLGGATEAAIWSVLHPILAVESSAPSIPYGRPMKNQQLMVLDSLLRPRPQWVAGDLFVAGAGLARGYWQDPEKTSGSFVTHPQTGERLYRTGDLARYLPSADLELLGREDLQVKIQGYRIELGEVEVVLAQHPDLRAVVACAVGGERDLRRLVAYAVAEPGAQPAAEELRTFAGERLPDYMVPTTFVMLDSLPLSANGKVDRGALPAPHADGAAPPAAVVLANDPTVRRVGILVAEILGRESVAANDDLLELGASSVELIRISNLLEQEFGFRPQIEEFYRHSTVAGLAAAIHPQEAAPPASSGDQDPVWQSSSLLIDPQERSEFKQAHHELRQDLADQPVTELPPLPVAEELRASYLERSSRRTFSQRPIPLTAVGSLLGDSFRLMIGDDLKALYPSASGLYPVQVYLHAKPERIEGLAGGLFYYHPLRHQLLRVAEASVLDRTHHAEFINRPVFDQAAFSILLIADARAIAPVYGGLARDFCLLEAGYLSQLMMLRAPARGLGLCPMGGLEWGRLKSELALDVSMDLVHSLLGGAVDEDSSSTASRQGVESSSSDREEIEL